MRHKINLFLSGMILFSVTFTRCTDKSILMPNEELHAEWSFMESETGSALGKVYFLNDSVGWSFGSDKVALRTEDGGKNWISMDKNFDEEYLDVFFINQNEGWILGRNTKGILMILKSTDNGTKWSQISTIPTPDGLYYAPSAMFHHMNFINSQTGWIAIVNFYMMSSQKFGRVRRIIKTTNGGLNWTEQHRDTLNGGNEVGFHGMHMLDENLGWVLGCQSVFKTINGGDTWIRQEQNVPTLSDESHWWETYFVNQNFGFFTTKNEGLLQTTDGGESWNQVLTEEIGEMFGIDFFNNQTGVVAGWEKIYATQDGGDNWEMVYENNEHRFRDVYFADENTIFAVGDNGVIVKISFSNSSASVAQKENPLTTPVNIALMQNFPNPFNPETVIEN